MSRAGTTEILVAHYLWVIIAPILIIFGTIGNLICVAVMCRRNMRSTNASVYLIALALADTSVLYTGLLRQFIIALTDVDLRNNSNLSCKINSWIVYVALDTSVWILVAFTFERILSVFVPHKVKSYCTRMSSVLVVSGVLIGMMAINGHILYGRDLKTFHRKNQISYFCDYVSTEYALFIGDVFPWLDFSVYCCVPFFILIIGNTCIATKVLLSRRKTRKVAVLNITPDPKLAPKNTTTKRSLKASKRVKRNSSMNTILLILNSVFLITTTPVSVYFIVLPKLQLQPSFYNGAILNLVYTVVNLVMYTNNSVNFILYCLTGSRFQKELCGMFRKANISSLERSGRSGQEEDPAGKSPSADRRVPVTQTSEVPFTVEPYTEPDTVHLTSLVITSEDAVNISSPVITDEDTVNITLPEIRDEDAVNITSSACIDQRNTVDINSSVISDKDHTVNINSSVVSDIDHTTKIISSVISDKDTVKKISPVIIDEYSGSNNCTSYRNKDTFKMSSPVITDKDAVKTTSLPTTDRKAVNRMYPAMKDTLKITLQLNQENAKFPSTESAACNKMVVTVPTILGKDLNRDI